VPLKKKKHVSSALRNDSLFIVCFFNNPSAYLFFKSWYAERILVKNVMKSILVIGFIFLSLATRAEPNINNLTQFKISSLQVFSSFSSFIYFQGDDRNRTRLLNAMKRGDKAISLLPETEVELKLKWKEVSDYVDSYQAHNFDGVDMSLEGGWSILQGELSKIIAARDVTQAEGIDDVQIKMESILTQYMAYANSTTGGYGVSYGSIPLEEQIKTMKQKLTDLAQADDQYQPLLKKWSYIQGTLLAYNSNVAPFVVLHTFDSMRKMTASD
jgi:hypothetical protein